MEYTDQKLTVKIGALICHPDIVLEEKYSIQNQISMLEARMNEDNMDIQSDIVNELKVSTLLFYQIEP